MAKCANCGWDWFKHRNKSQCPATRANPDGSKPRFKNLPKRKANTPNRSQNNGT